MQDNSNRRGRWRYSVFYLSMRADGAIIVSTALADDPSQYGDTMTKENKAEGHTYTVQLRFSGDKLEPAEISARLNLLASHSSSQLQNLSTTKKRRPFWAYNGLGAAGFQSDWICLEDGLEFLLKSLSSRKTEISSLARQFDGLWWCGHFQASFDGGPTLSARLLAEIGSYEIPLHIDNYFSDE